MAHSPKRITRKDLRRPDQFVTFTTRLIDWVRHHRKPFLLGLGVFVGALLLYGGWDLYTSRQNRLAAQEYARALSLFHEQKYREAVGPLTELTKSAPRMYRRLALLYLGNTHLALGEPKAAAGVFERLAREDPKPDYLGQLALLSLAQAYEKTGNLKEAAQSYAAAGKLSGPFKQQAMLGEARTEAQAGELKGALEAYRAYLAAFPGAQSSGEILLRVQELEAKVGTPPEKK